MTDDSALGKSRRYEEILTDAIRVLTEAARFPLRAEASRPAAPPGRVDFAEFLTFAVAATAANIGGVEALLAGRPGSWEADYVRNMLHSTVGYDEERLFGHRREPFVVTIHVANVLDDLGYTALFDDTEDELIRRDQAIGEVIGDNEPTAGQEAELAEIEELFQRLEELRRADWVAYGEAFREQVRAVVAEQYPDLQVPVDVVVELDWHEDYDSGEWWTAADAVRSIAHARTPLPSSGIPPAEYLDVADIAGTERAAGRDPLTRLTTS